MKVCLVTASTFNGVDADARSEPLDEDSPLGILSLAACLRARGTDVVFCDFTQFLREVRRPGIDPCGPAADWVLGTSADVFAFSTICSTYPFTLRVAEDVRRRAPHHPLILGGPQATVTDRGVLSAFSCIDVVVRGEGEYVLPEVLDALEGRRRLSSVAGITYRALGTPWRTPDAPVILDLDALPDPAYELDPLTSRRRFLSLELGRGCPFACEFCSTNDFFRRRFRLKSPARVIAQMRRAHEQFGHRRFSLVHDMFTVDRRRVVAFCEAMREADTGFEWTCSARTDSVDPELLRLMADSGCVSVFFGVESGSQAQQRRMNKDLDVDEARRAIACATGLGMSTSVSLIVGFPDEPPEDFRQTVSFMLDAARHDRAHPRMHLLAPLVGTPLAVKYRDQVRLVAGIYSDASVATIGLQHASPERALIEAHPDLFLNFYLMPMQLPPAYLGEARLFLSDGIRRCRWLFVALDREVPGGILSVFDEWLNWRAEPASAGRYYRSRRFVEDLLAFLFERYHGRGYRASDVLIRYLRDLIAAVAADESPGGPADDDVVSPPTTGSYAEDAVPHLPPNTWLLELRGSVPAVIESLRAQRLPAENETDRPAHLLVRDTPQQWQELTELPPVAAAVLRLCDGRRQVADVIDAFDTSAAGFAPAPPGPVCEFVLQRLSEARILTFAASPSRHSSASPRA